MTEFTLLMLEISGIQDFIFGSNNLRINVSSSALIFAVTNQWIPDILPGLYSVDSSGERVPRNKDTRPNNLNVECIYMGGGNAFLIFEDAENSQQFVRKISRRLLLEAPDLRAVIATTPFDWEKDILVKKHKALRSALAEKKQQLAPNRLKPAAAVGAVCSFTGQAASQTWFEHFISPSVATRLNYYLSEADNYLTELVPDITEAGFAIIKDFDEFGGEGNSFMAVVHADGNRMGERIKALGSDCAAPEKNREYVHRLRTFSQSAHEAAQTALQDTALHLLKAKRWDSQKKEWCWQRQNGVQPADRERLPKVVLKDNLFPFRPIVFGGDDVTFVCDGRVGLALAQHYLTTYGEQELADGKKAVGRAGIAIVNTHYPFAQAYGLAEELASSAKSEGEAGKLASLDWHFGVNGVLDPLKAIRETSYTVTGGSLHFRPVRLAGKDRPNWATFTGLVSQFQIGDEWRNKRSKLKGLQTALRGGPTETRAYLLKYGLQSLPQVDASKPQFETDGWVGGRCPYFDALEAMDFFIPLEEPA